MHLRREIRLSVSGTVLRVARSQAGLAGTRSQPGAIRSVPGKPRSAGEFRHRLAASPIDESWPDARLYGAHAALAGHPDAVSGAGVPVVQTVSLFCRSPRKTRSNGGARASRIPGAVSQSGIAGLEARFAPRPVIFRTVQARLVRIRIAFWRRRAPPRFARSSPE